MVDLDLAELKRRYINMVIGREPPPDPNEPQDLLSALQQIVKNTAVGRPLGGS